MTHRCFSLLDILVNNYKLLHQVYDLFTYLTSIDKIILKEKLIREMTADRIQLL